MKVITTIEEAMLVRLDNRLTHDDLMVRAQQLMSDNAWAYKSLHEENNQPETREALIELIGCNLTRIGYINNKLGYIFKEEQTS